MDVLLDTHYLDMVEVFRCAPHDLPEWVDFALLKHPRLRPLDHARGGPSRQRALLEDEACCAKRALGCNLARDDVARQYMVRVGIGVSEEVRERDNGPGIAVMGTAGECRCGREMARGRPASKRGP